MGIETTIAPLHEKISTGSMYAEMFFCYDTLGERKYGFEIPWHARFIDLMTKLTLCHPSIDLDDDLYSRNSPFVLLEKLSIYVSGIKSCSKKICYELKNLINKLLFQCSCHSMKFQMREKLMQLNFNMRENSPRKKLKHREKFDFFFVR